MKSQRLALVLAGCVFLAFTVYSFFPVLRCIEGCFVDFHALHGGGKASFEDADTRFNTWILAWVQHSLTSQPFELFRTNAFYPAPDALAGSEHMIGIALLTLPIKLLTSNAVLVYQFAMMLSFLILGLTTFALVRWLTGSVWVAIVAGVIALFMPWRTHELAHLQLLGAHWFPLIWLLTFRILLKNGKPQDGVLLSAVLSLQLLSSYYLAYLITFSIALLSLMILL